MVTFQEIDNGWFHSARAGLAEANAFQRIRQVARASRQL
jgi:hypothetical protein